MQGEASTIPPVKVSGASNKQDYKTMHQGTQTKEAVMNLSYELLRLINKAI